MPKDRIESLSLVRCEPLCQNNGTYGTGRGIHRADAIRTSSTNCVESVMPIFQASWFSHAGFPYHFLKIRAIGCKLMHKEKC